MKHILRRIEAVVRHPEIQPILHPTEASTIHHLDLRHMRLRVQEVLRVIRQVHSEAVAVVAAVAEEVTAAEEVLAAVEDKFLNI